METSTCWPTVRTPIFTKTQAQTQPAKSRCSIEARPDSADWLTFVEQGAETMRNTRPTAQDLFYAIEKVLAAVRGAPSVIQARQAAVAAAQAIADENVAACKAIAEHGASLQWMQQIKSVFDPNGILNPGKIFPS